MISAVILSGGHSRRMGQDKAGLVLEGQTFLERIVEQLDGIEDLYLSVSRPEAYKGCGLPRIFDEYEECGPMGGIHKALGVCRHEYLFVTACDMPFMDAGFAFYLTQFLTEDTDAVIPVGRDGRRYVLGALYHRRVKAVIEDQLQKGDRRLTNILKTIRAVYVTLPSARLERKLMNVNHPEAYQALLKGHGPAVSFVGYSGGGKTTLMEQVISLLESQGIRTACVKHTHHAISFPPEGKDSQRMIKAGARVSAVVSSEQALIVENREVDVHRLLQKIQDVDLILIEGYKQKDFPKIMVGAQGLYPEAAGPCLAVVSDENTKGDVPWFSRDDPEGLSRFIIEYFHLGEGR